MQSFTCMSRGPRHRKVGERTKRAGAVPADGLRSSACFVRMGARLVPVLSRRRVMGERCEAIEERFVRDAAGVGRDPRAILAQGGSATRDATILVRCVLRIGVDLSLFDRYVAWQIASTQSGRREERWLSRSSECRTQTGWSFPRSSERRPQTGWSFPRSSECRTQTGWGFPRLRSAHPRKEGGSPDPRNRSPESVSHSSGSRSRAPEKIGASYRPISRAKIKTPRPRKGRSHDARRTHYFTTTRGSRTVTT
jgi:hypothetical protein